MDFVELVKQKRAENIVVYSTTDRFRADYKAEVSIRDDYVGRQLLELLQNADDAKAERIKIIKNSSEHSITICNTGEPFSVGGFGALMLSYNGTKSAGKKEFIGNKGLGFKSILNWATSVDVKSNGCHAHFSRKTAYNVAKRELATCWDKIQSLIDSLGLVNKEIAPILSLPEIEPCETKINGWDTEITIHYDPSSDVEKDIDAQIELLNSKSLLFVSNIRRLEIEGSKSDRCYDSAFATKSEYGVEYFEFNITESKQGTSRTHQYRLFKQEGVVDSETQKAEQKDQLTEDPMYYEVCIALDGEIGQKEFLYSYFRTKIMVGLPCIIHAAFRLDSSRNSLIADSVINRFLIEKVVSQFRRVTRFICKAEPQSWHAFKLINFDKKPDENQAYLGQLYDSLEELKYNSDIFPCVDGKYRVLDEIHYYDDVFSKFIQENYSDVFPDMLIPTNGICQNEINSYVDDDPTNGGLFYSEEEIWEKLDELCKRVDTIQQRVALLKALCSEKVIEHIPNEEGRQGQKHLLAIMLDEEDKVINPRKSIYTTPSKSLNTPSFANISFIGSKFYEALKDAFPFNPYENDPELNTPIHARQICKRIKHFVKLKAHDVANLTPEIINATNSRIDGCGSKEEAKKYLVETVQTLFKNHEILGSSGEGSENKYDGLRLIAKSGDIVDAKTLYLSSTYKSGEITETFYGDVIPPKEYIADRSEYAMAPIVDAIDPFEDFLVLCGVTRYARYNPDYLLTNDTVDMRYLQKYLAPICGEFTKYGCKNYPLNKVCKLTDSVKLDRLPLTNALILLAKEKAVCSSILSGSYLVYKGANLRGQYEAHAEVSLSAYQMMNRFSSIVLQKDDSEINFLLNPKGGINVDLLKTYGVEYDCYEILGKLGVKKNFQEASPDALYAVIRRVFENKQRYPKGRGIQKIYGDVYDVLKKQPSHDHGDLMLACRVGDGDVEFKKNSEIYYYDDATLPKTMLLRYPIFLFRQRAGVEQVVNYFGVKRLDVSSLIIDESSMDERKELSQEFNKHYYDRIPFIVMQRIRGLVSGKSLKEEALRALISFHLVKSGKYSFSGNTMNLEAYEFLIKGRNAYIQVPDLPLKTLIREKKILDAFSEILSIAFALESSDLKKIFRTILRDDLPTLRADAEEDMDDYERALDLLSRSESSETEFWNRVLKKKNKDIFGLHTGMSLEKYIQERLSYKLPSFYGNVDFDLFDNEDSFNFVKDVHEQLQLDLKDFLLAKGLVAYHREKLKNVIRHYYKVFISQLWNNLKDKGVEEQRQYCRICCDYENCGCSIPMDDYKYNLDLDYSSLLKEYVTEKYGINLDSGKCLDYKGILYAGYTEGRDVSLTFDDRSLLYFEGYEEKFNNLQKENGEDNIDDENSETDGNDNLVGVVGIIKPVERIRRDRGSRSNENNQWNADEKSMEKKKKAGKKAQDSAMQWLKGTFGETSCRLRSSESDDPSKNDAAHYDILYCETPEKKDAEWRYLEVKNASSKSFIISEAEVEFGCNPENRKKYDLALVDGKKVQIVKSFFADYDSPEAFIETFRPHIHRDFLISFRFENGEEGV